MRQKALCGIGLLFVVFGVVAGQDKAAFDARSFPRTFDWYIDQWQTVEQSPNGIAFQANLKKMHEAFEALQGTKVDWVVPLKRADLNGLSFLVDKKGDGKRTKAYEFRIYPIRVPEADWVMKVKPGDPVRIQGIIGKHRLESAGFVKRIGIPITDAKLSLPPRK